MEIGLANRETTSDLPPRARRGGRRSAKHAPAGPDGPRSDGSRSDGPGSDGPGSDGTGSEGTGSDGTGTATKALRLLEAVARLDRSASVAELAVRLDLSKPTAHRVATKLESLGFLDRELGSRRLIEGDRLVALALDVLERAARRAPRHMILQGLAEVTGETCNLGVLHGGEVVYIDRVESRWPLGLRFNPGSQVPMHCTAIGKLLLSRMPERQLEAHLSAARLTRYTENTITDPDRLRAEVERIRAAVISEDDQEFMSGVVCLAVPVQAPGRRVSAGIAVSAPMARLTLEQIRAFAPQLREAADKLARTLPADEPDLD